MIEATRICKKCGKQFKPEAGRQIFCSPECRRATFNEQRKARRHIESGKRITDDNGKILSSKEYLSVTDAAIYLNVSRPTIYRRIKTGELKTIRISSRTIRISTKELLTETKLESTHNIGDFSIPIKIEEVILRYDINRTEFFEIIAKHNIAVRKRRRIAYYPQKTLDEILPRREHFNPSEWYTIEEVMKTSGYSHKVVCSICLKGKVPKVRKDGILYISKRWDTHRYSKEDLKKNYMTRQQAIEHYRIGNEKFYNFVNESGIQKHRDGNSVYFRKSDLDKLFKKK